ncbi:MAG: hypothetical protein R2940_07400 [Syntrophotaleaceae bacterium]
MKNLPNLIGLLVLSAFLSACAADLKPAPSATTVPRLEEAARSSVGGVKMIAQADEWPGPVDVKEVVTPVRVVVENNSGQPLRIAYTEFALVAPDGRRFSALPPFQIEGEVSQTATAVVDPIFGYRGFEIAPGYGPYYPGIGTYREPFYYDPYYYGTYRPYWVQIDLPTEEMIQRALPEGVLNSGGRIDGYLYFEDDSDDVGSVTFRADLVNARKGTSFGEIRIPFIVE